nr:putative ribonuclease H-like domain-containing protein [Tanacetum cinerariifolium]
MPFGLCNALGTFQRNSFQSCLSHLKRMLKTCEDTNLCLNYEKNHFMVKEGIVLGHKISKQWIEVDKAKVDVITKLPHPTTVKGIRSFLESNYTTTEKEMLAVVYAFEKFWSYLIMNKSIVYTDHSALKYLFAKKIQRRDCSNRNRIPNPIVIFKHYSTNDTRFSIFTPRRETTRCINLSITPLEPAHADLFGDETELDMSNISTIYLVPSTPNTRIHKDYSLDHVIGDVQSGEESKKVWTLVDLPYGKRAIGTKWIYRNKKDQRGIVVRNKARLVAQGYTQEEEIDYDKVFAPVARIEAIRLFLAYASFKDFVVYQMDVKSAFLYGKIEEKVYVCQTLGFEDPEFPHKVYKIDKTLFIKRFKGDILLVQVYVDDIIFWSKRKEMCTEFKKTMHKKFHMSSMGWLTFFLGLQVTQKDDGIFISRDKYVDEILKKFGFSTVKTASTPIKTSKLLFKDTKAEDVDVHLYRSMIGSLMYLIASMPHIMFDACACVRFQVTPKVSHLHAVKRIFRYLKGKPKLGLWYLKDSPFDWKLILTVTMLATTKVKIVDGEEQIQALVDKKKVIITETSVKSDLHLEDVEGTECMPIATIFKQLTLMGAKTTAWNEFSSTVASAIILHLDSQVEGMLKHKEIYVTPSHTRNNFANMKRLGKDFSGKVTPLFQTMMVQAQEDMDEHVTTTSNDPLLSVDETQGRNDQDMFDTGVLDDEEVVAEKEVTTADPVITVREVVTTVGVEVSTTAITPQISMDMDEITLTKALIDIKTSKPKAKRIVMLARKKEKEANIALIVEWDDVQAMMDADHELAERLQTEEQGELTIKERREEEKTSNQNSKEKDNVYLSENHDIAEGSETRAERSSKREGEELESDKSKKQKLDEQVEAEVDNDQREAKMKMYMKIIHDDEIAIDAIPLATKPPIIVD